MSRVCPITAKARVLAERAITALHQLQEADPFVAAALREAIADADFVLCPMTARAMMQDVRLVAHEMKLRAVHQAAGIDPESTELEIRAFRETVQ